MKNEEVTLPQPHRADPLLFVVVLLLVGLGLVMVFSASYPRGLEGFNDPFYFIMRQLAWLAVGIATLIIAARVPYPFWNR